MLSCQEGQLHPALVPTTADYPELLDYIRSCISSVVPTTADYPESVDYIRSCVSSVVPTTADYSGGCYISSVVASQRTR